MWNTLVSLLVLGGGGQKVKALFIRHHRAPGPVHSKRDRDAQFPRVASTRRHASNSDTTMASFETMTDVETRVASLLSEAPDCLGGFFESKLNSFSVIPGSTSRFSVTSTCFALQVNVDTPSSHHPPSLRINNIRCSYLETRRSCPTAPLGLE